MKVYKYAFRNSKFYNQKYRAAGLNENSIQSYEDINKVPILTKEEVKGNLNTILTVSKDSKFLSKGATGGSTGIPMHYFTDKRIPVEAFSWRYLKWWHIKPWNNGAFIWRMKEANKFKQFVNKIAWWPVKKMRLDATFLNEDKFRLFAANINKLKPYLIQGYVGSVYEFALYLEANKIKIYSPKAVWVTSAPLAKHQRVLIEKIFQAPLYNEYGSSEIPWIASQCYEKKHLHVNSEGRYLELINVDSKGVGDIIITDLLNMSFPLIRYELGDKTSFVNGSCACGSNLPLINEVQGRKGDVIVVPNIGKLDGSYLTTIFDAYPLSILAFQVIQHKNYNITLKIVPNTKYDNWKHEVDAVYANLVKLVKNKVKVSILYEKAILSDRGKTRFIIREL